MWGRILLLSASLITMGSLRADDPKPPELTAEEKKLAEEAKRTSAEARQLFGQRKTAEAVDKLRQSLALYERVYSSAKYPDGHIDLAVCLGNLGSALHAAGSVRQAIPYIENALAMFRKLYPESKYSNGHPDLVIALNKMGLALRAAGFPDRSLKYLEQALLMNKRLYPQSKYPNGHAEIATSLRNLGFALQAAGLVEKALDSYGQALAMNRKLYSESTYPDGHPELASCLNNLGHLLWATGFAERSLNYFEQALAMNRRLYPEVKFPNGHPELARALNNLGSALEAAGSVDKALQFYEQALTMRRTLYPKSLYPNGHPELATTLNNLGTGSMAVGLKEKAITVFEQALAMRRQLYPESTYPDGHPELAQALENLANALKDAQLTEKALLFQEQSLAMCRKLYTESKYPNGHPQLAGALNSTGSASMMTGAVEKAKDFHEQALSIYRKIYPKSEYPDGHPHLAGCLNNVGYVWYVSGSSKKALVYFEQALEMYRNLYPESVFSSGHPDLVRSLINVGTAFEASGFAEKALPLFERSLTMQRKLGQWLLLTSSQDDAFAYVRSQPASRDSYLSAALKTPGTESASYRAIWNIDDAVTQILELRLAAARGQVVNEGLTSLRENRRRIEQTLEDRRSNSDDRARELTRLANERDAIERRLATDLPILARWKERQDRTPEDLAKSLPAGTVFIDLMSWARLEYDPKGKDENTKKQVPSYLAFVIARPSVENDPGFRTVSRIELGPAVSIDSAITTWRTAIEDRRDVRGIGAGNTVPKELTTSKSGEVLRKLVWEPLAKHLPPGTKTIYFALDRDLARMPWAALPIGNGRVLLEDYEVAVVPHGPFLLEQLKYPRKYEGPDSAFVLGGVEYGPKWPVLPGTKVELENVVALAPGDRETASGEKVTVDMVAKTLAKSRYAHFATHGFFDAEKFAEEKKREDIAFKNRQFGDETRRVVSKNPLGFVGLVLSNGEIMSGLSILDLPLENLELVTLSACETGLGEYTGGKGVENLQMAFHVAGCPNVIASLWKVNDAATAALMKRFYHELWVNKKPPLAALREAQLFIYYHPELIPDVLGERGAPKAKEAIALKPLAALQGTAKPRAATKLWAAFVLSGLGN